MNEFINLIESQLGSDFERELFTAIQVNLNDKSNVLRLNNFAYSARELIRIVLDRLAPTEDVLKCPWYKDETDVKGRPTRAQRIFYAIHGGLETSYVEDKLGIPVKHTKQCIVDRGADLSKYTHITEDTFNIQDPENVVAIEALSSLSNFLEMLVKCRSEVAGKLSEEVIDSKVIDGILFETDLSLDELATHYFIDHAEIHESTVEYISSDTVYIKAYGTVYVELQWGSNSDLRKDEGATMSQSFPLVASLSTPLNAFDEIELIYVGTNTSGWWDNYCDPE